MILLASIFALLADGRFERVHHAGNALVLDFTTAANKIYILDSAERLDGAWREAHLFGGTGANVGLTNELSAKTRFFRARAFPNVLTSKPGTPFAWNLGPLSNSEAAWSIEGEIPAGIDFAAGTFSGTPTAEAAEAQPAGNYTNTIRLAGGGSAEIVQHVRLSFARNIYPQRPNGPSLGPVCLKCHGSGFTPDFTPDARTILNQPASGDDSCPEEWRYIVPGDPQNSLIYRKVAAPPCGDRMPQGGPFFNQTQIERLARWIAELQVGDTD